MAPLCVILINQDEEIKWPLRPSGKLKLIMKRQRQTWSTNYRYELGVGWGEG